MGRDNPASNATLADRLVSQQDLAGVFACTQQEISRLTMLGVLVRVVEPARGRPGMYRFGESVRRWVAYHEARNAVNPLEEALARAKLDKAHAQAQLARVRTEERMRELVPVDAVVEFVRRLEQRMREALLPVADRVAAKVAGTKDAKRIEAVMQEDLIKQFNELNKLGPELVKEITSEYDAGLDEPQDIDELAEETLELAGGNGENPKS